MPRTKKDIHIGTSGWSYEHWNETFYPKEIKSNERLQYYASHFKTVEINNTFYHLPTENVIKNWYEKVPSDFIFSIKASQYITHRKRLKDPNDSTSIFFERLQLFKNKAGPILFQLPPSFKKNFARLEEFLMSLEKGYLYTFEFRHPSWFVDEIYELLKKHHVALCITDIGGHLTPEEVTTNFAYFRFHGPQGTYRGYYGTKALKEWKDKLLKLQKRNIQSYVYFDNDEKAYAIRDAKELQALIEG
jgi:uncharacterized protein YecE (DUF72 family)